MSLGSIFHRFRMKCRHGLRVAYWRDIARQRILETAPVSDTNDPACEIHVMTSADDWINLLWALKSFFAKSGRRYRLCIHCDATVGAEQLETLRRHFPAARVIDRATADVEVIPALENYPRCLKLRVENHLSPKVFDFAHYLGAERMLLLDSDVLFFASPEELLRRIEDPTYLKNTVNADIASAYTVEPEIARSQAGVDLIARFNSGLGLIHRDSMRLDWLEEFLALPGIIGHFWRIEQTLFALCSSRFGVELLPRDYDVRMEPGIGESPCRHYIGHIRHLMYGEGMRRLVKDGFLRGDSSQNPAK